MSKLTNLDLDALAQVLALEMEATDDPDLALQNALNRLATGEPSGFSGPAGRTDEVQFTSDGRPILLFHKGINFPKVEPEQTRKGKGGLFDSNSQPSLPEAPNMDQMTNLRRKPWEKWPTEGKTNFLSQLETRYKITSKRRFFKDVISTVKGIYPDIKMVFPQPPTYIWNPKNETEKLDINGIKNKLKIRFPDLEWSNREMDGVPIATMIFSDGSSAEFSIGEEANHLTIIYVKPEPVQAPIEEDYIPEE